MDKLEIVTFISLVVIIVLSFIIYLKIKVNEPYYNNILCLDCQDTKYGKCSRMKGIEKLQCFDFCNNKGSSVC